MPARSFWMPHLERVHIRVIIVMIVATLLFIVSKQILVSRYLDISDYYTYQGTAGPFSAVIGSDGKVSLGPPISRIRAGETMGWTTTSCFSAPIDGYFVANFVRATDGVAVQSKSEIFVGTKCGPSNGSVVIPNDIDPGQYSLRREMVLRPPKGPPISSELPAIHIEVIR